MLIYYIYLSGGSKNNNYRLHHVPLQVVDVTIAYPEEGKPLDLVSIFTGWTPPTTTHVHYRYEIKRQ